VSVREQAQNSPAAEGPDPSEQAHDRAAYLAFVAHEMRNPLSTALWSAELLARMSAEERGGARGEKLARMCLRTLVRLRHLVEDHFLAERLSIRGIPLRTEITSLDDVVKTAATRCGVQPEDVDVGGLAVRADRAMLERAVEALLASTVRDGATVTVRARTVRGSAQLEVRGAPPPDQPFRHPDRSTLSDPTGRALALLAARGVAAAHGGSLEANADGYILSLPADDGAGPAGDHR
jgi:signal transduction histidine kinase